MAVSMENCPDCGARPGEMHGANCYTRTQQPLFPGVETLPRGFTEGSVGNGPEPASALYANQDPGAKSIGELLDGPAPAEAIDPSRAHDVGPMQSASLLDACSLAAYAAGFPHGTSAAVIVRAWRAEEEDERSGYRVVVENVLCEAAEQIMRAATSISSDEMAVAAGLLRHARKVSV